jgi:hypothetical protein
MVFKLAHKTSILQRLYTDYVCYVEEISLIEEDYLWPNVSVYVDNPKSIEDFLVLSCPSFYWEGKSLSAYMTTRNKSNIRVFAEVLKTKRDFQTHLQISGENETCIRQFMDWLPKSYAVRYLRADSQTFKPYLLNSEKAVQLTPENIKQLQPSVSPHFVKRIATAPVYGYLNEKQELVAMSGVGFLTKNSFAISYTETNVECRNKGLAK